MSIVGLTGAASLLTSAATTMGSQIKAAQPGSFLTTLMKGMQSQTPDPAAAATATDAATTDVGQLKDQTNQAKQQFQQKLIRMLLEQGVDLSQPLTLQSDGFGGVKVAGSHSDKDAIEALFEDNPDLREGFQQLSSQADQLYQRDKSSFTTTDGPSLTTDGLPTQTQPQFSLIVRNGSTDMAYLRST